MADREDHFSLTKEVAFRDERGRFVSAQQFQAVKGSSTDPGISSLATAGSITDNGEVKVKDVPPPRLYDSVVEVMRSFVRLVHGVLMNSDVAYRRDRDLQRMMRNDPDVMGPLIQRQLAVALLDWEVIAQDEENDEQVEQAKKIKELLTHHMHRWHDFVRSMQEAVWFGPAAVNLVYERVSGGFIAPTGWRPFHPDSLAFTEEGDLALRVGLRYKGEKLMVWDGFVHKLTDMERRTVALHTFMPQGPDYEELFEGRYAWAGRGLRDIVWFQWLMKQTALQLWMTYIERYGMGIRVGTYPAGNDGGRDAMDKALKNILGDVSVLIPDDSDKGQKPRYKIDIMEPPAGEAKVFADLIEGYLAGQIKELIIGQTATTEATNTGLGSDVGTRHAETFWRLIRFDALSLSDSLTRDLVHPMSEMNFGNTPHRPRLRFVLEEVDSEKFMAGVVRYVGIGGTVATRQVRGRLGIEEPREGEDVLGGREQPGGGALGGFGGGGGTDSGAVADQVRRALQG